MDLGKASAWATIIGLPVAIIGLVIAVLTIPEAHDYILRKLLHRHEVVQQSPARSVRQPVPPSTNPVPVHYEDHDICTGVQYQRTLSYDKMEHVNPDKVRGGDSNTPGREIVINWSAPGPVRSVSGKCLVGWCVIESCRYTGNVAHCEGWTNDGNHGTINMDVTWVQPQPDHC